jgi:hypothetical protein
LFVWDWTGKEASRCRLSGRRRSSGNKERYVKAKAGFASLFNAATALTVLVVLAALAGCGGGGGDTTTAAAPGPSRAETTPPKHSAGAEPGKVSSSTPKKTPEPRSAGTSAPKPAATGSSEFVTPQGDNSVPNFGDEADARERALAGAALERYLVAREKGDWALACSDLTGKARSELKLIIRGSNGKVKDCAAVLTAYVGEQPTSSRKSPFLGEISALRMKGGQAFALFHGAQDTDYVMPMQKQGSEWKVTQIAPIVYPIGTPEPSR